MHLPLGDFDVLNMIDSLVNLKLWSFYTNHSPVKISSAKDNFKRVKMQSGKCVRVTSGRSWRVVVLNVCQISLSKIFHNCYTKIPFRCRFKNTDSGLLLFLSSFFLIIIISMGCIINKLKTFCFCNCEDLTNFMFGGNSICYKKYSCCCYKIYVI